MSLRALSLVCVITFWLTGCASQSQVSDTTQAPPEPIVKKLTVNPPEIMAVLDKISMRLETNEGGNANVRKSLSTVIHAVRSLEIPFLMGDFNYPLPLAATSFVIENPKAPYFTINPIMLDFARSHPFLMEAILAFHLQQAADFLHLKNVIQQSNLSPIDGFYYKVDALFTEVLYLQEYRLWSDEPATEYEKYLITSLNRDGLNTASAVFLGMDMVIAHNLNNIASKAEYINTGTTYFEQYLEQLLAIDVPKDEFQKYLLKTQLGTIASLAPQAIFNMVNRLSGYGLNAGRYDLRQRMPHLYRLVLEAAAKSQGIESDFRQSVFDQFHDEFAITARPR